MDCERASDRVYHYLDGRLTFYRRWRITRHLSRCPPCQQGFDFEVELREFVAARCRDEIPADLRRRIAEALRREADRADAAE